MISAIAVFFGEIRGTVRFTEVRGFVLMLIFVDLKKGDTDFTYTNVEI